MVLIWALKYSTSLANKFDYQGINLNVGAPLKDFSRENGACLMKEAELVRDCLSGMREETSMDVSLNVELVLMNLTLMIF